MQPEDIHRIMKPAIGRMPKFIELERRLMKLGFDLYRTLAREGGSRVDVEKARSLQNEIGRVIEELEIIYTERKNERRADATRSWVD